MYFAICTTKIKMTSKCFRFQLQVGEKWSKGRSKTTRVEIVKEVMESMSLVKQNNRNIRA